MLDPRTDCVDGPDFVFVAFQEEGRIFVYATGSGGWECEARNLMTEQLLIKWGIFDSRLNLLREIVENLNV